MTQYTITPSELKLRLQNEPELLLVDVRAACELASIPKIGNAINIPFEDIEQRANELPKDKQFVLYCKKGIRSQHAMQTLRASGYDCLSMSEGIEAW